MRLPRIMVMGIGCTLLSDEGFGIRIIEELERRYRFPDHVELVDGAMLGVRMTGCIARADHLIVIDTVRGAGRPGEIHRWEAVDIPERLLKKNTVQHVDFVESFIRCQGIDSAPRTVMLAVEPEDTTLACRLSPALEKRIETVVGLVLDELRRLGVECLEK